MPIAEVILPPSAAAQRAAFNKQFTPPDAQSLKIETAAYKPADEHEAAYFMEKISLERKKAHMGVEPMSVLNLNPFVLELNSALFYGLKVPPCPIGEPYTKIVIRETRYEVKQTVNGMLPADQDPFFLAMAFKTMYEDVGGVVVIRGDIERNPALLNSEEVKAMQAEAKQRAIQTAIRLKQEGDGEWNTPTKGSRTINDTHRNAARVLLHERLIDELPPWISSSRTPSEKVPECPVCMTEPKKGAILCGSCQYILDPAAAFKRGLIKEDHESLFRLTRKQLKELHITKAQIPETLDERDARMKKAAAEEGE